MSIPAHIIQTARSRNLPPRAEAGLASARLMHPDWKHTFFDDAAIQAFVAKEFPQYVKVFESFRFNIQRIDFFRYLAVYRLGGFYFDLDVLFTNSLIPLLEEQCVFPFEELTLNHYLRQNHAIDWEIGNYGFGAAPNNPFLKAVIDNCVRAQTDNVWVDRIMKGIPAVVRNDLYVLNTTGPGLLTRTLAENRDLSSDVTLLFPHDVCDSQSWHLFGHYGVHLMEGSWRTKGNVFKRRLARFWESRTRKTQMHESRRQGPTRTFGKPRKIMAPEHRSGAALPIST